MEKMDKGLTVPKWVLINRSQIHQMAQNLSAQIVCPSSKNWDFDEKMLHWVSVVRVCIKRTFVWFFCALLFNTQSIIEGHFE